LRRLDLPARFLLLLVSGSGFGRRLFLISTTAEHIRDRPPSNEIPKWNLLSSLIEGILFHNVHEHTFGLSYAGAHLQVEPAEQFSQSAPPHLLFPGLLGHPFGPEQTPHASRQSGTNKSIDPAMHAKPKNRNPL